MITRRSFFKAAAVAGAATAAASSGCAHTTETHKPGEGPRWGMVIDLRKCFGCHACSVACKAEQDVPLGYFKSWVAVSEKGTYPDVSRHFLRVMCNQCDQPPCVEGCPTGATWQRRDGIVIQEDEACIGCGYCIEACPYHAKYEDPRTHTAQKCDFCVHRLDQGLAPACINSCNARALIFGDLNDPESEVSKLLATNAVQVLMPHSGTEPRVYYIGLDGASADPTPARPVVDPV